MRKNNLIIIFHISFFLFLFLKCTDSRQEQQTVHEIFRLNNSKSVLEMMASIVETELASVKNQVEDTVYIQISEAARRSFNPEQLHAKCRERFLINNNPKYARELRNWLRSGSYQKIITAENQVLGYEEKMQIIQLRDYFNNDSTLQKRHQLLKSALQDEEVELTADLFEVMKKSLFIKIRDHLKSDQEISMDQVETMIQRDKKELKKVLRENALLERLYRYRYIPIEDLKNYADFSNSSAGKWGIRNTYQSILAVLTDAAEHFDKTHIIQSDDSRK